MKTSNKNLLSKVTTPSPKESVRGRSLLLILLLLATTAGYAQSAAVVQPVEDWMSSLISRAIDNKVEVSKSLGQERDLQHEGSPLKWRSDIYQFSLPRKQHPLLDEMIKAFEANGNNPNCYGVNSMSESSSGTGQRNLMIGEDPNRFVTIGKDYTNYVNINILDAADTTKTHRYAYALEWRDGGRGKTDVRYIITYAKIPSAASVLSQPSSPFFNFGHSRIRQTPSGGKVIICDSVKVDMDGRLLPLDSLESILADAQKRLDEAERRIDSIWFDYDEKGSYKSLHKWVPRKKINEKVNNENFLLNFYNLYDHYWKNKTTVLTAISTYELCKICRENDLLTDPEYTTEREEVMKDLDTLIEVAKTDTDRKYFQMARSQLQKVKDGK